MNAETQNLLKHKMQLMNAYKSHTSLFDLGKVIKGYRWFTVLHPCKNDDHSAEGCIHMKHLFYLSGRKH